MNRHQHRERIARSISWGHWFTFANIFLALLIGSLYFSSVSTTGSTLARIYLGLSWLGHFSFLPFAFFIVLLFPLCLALPYSRFLRAVGAIVASFALFALLLDAVFFHYYGFHLNTYALAQLATDAEKWLSGGSFILLIATLLSFLGILAIQILLTNVTWKKLDQLRQVRALRAMPIIFVSAFFLSHLMHVWADANLFRPITQQDDLFPLSYPTTAKSLMSRHGWIDITNLDSQRLEATKEVGNLLNYPINPLLCARESHAEPTLVIAFDQLQEQQVEQLKQSLQGFHAFSGKLLGHPQVSSGFFQLAYGIPDRYLDVFNQKQIAPAYLKTLNDLDYPVQWTASPQFNKQLLPKALQSSIANANTQLLPPSGIRVVFADSKDLPTVIAHIERVARSLPQAAIYVTAASPARSSALDEQAKTLIERLNVPLLTYNVTIYPERQLAQLNDIMPTVLSRYMSCADKNRSYSNGMHLNSPSSGYPRAASIYPNIYLFEDTKTSVLNIDGDVDVYGSNGESIPNAEPTTSVLIQGLNELQRFSKPKRKD